VFEWGDMSTQELLFQWASTMKVKLSGVDLVKSGPHDHLMEN
jgi:hypothetical protein